MTAPEMDFDAALAAAAQQAPLVAGDSQTNKTPVTVGSRWTSTSSAESELDNFWVCVLAYTNSTPRPSSPLLIQKWLLSLDLGRNMLTQ